MILILHFFQNKSYFIQLFQKQIIFYSIFSKQITFYSTFSKQSNLEIRKQNKNSIMISKIQHPNTSRPKPKLNNSAGTLGPTKLQKSASATWGIVITPSPQWN